MAPSDPSWNFQDPASKERVLSVPQGEEMDSMFDPGHGQGRRPGGQVDWAAVLDLDPATLVLAGKFRDLFFPI